MLNQIAMKTYERNLISPTITESITKSSNNIEKNLNSNNPFIKNIAEEMKEFINSHVLCSLII